MWKTISILSVLGLFGAAIVLQSGPREDRLLGRDFYDPVNSRGIYVSKSAGASQVTVSVFFPADSQEPSPSQVSMDLPLAAAVEAIVAGPQAAVDTFVVSGKDSNGNGVMYLIKEGISGFALSGTPYTEIGSDFVGLSYSSSTGRLYALDADKNRIVWSTFAPSATNLPTTWQTGLSGTSMPSVVDLVDYHLGIIADGVEPEFHMTHGFDGIAPDPRDWFKIKHTQTGFTVTLVSGRAGKAGSITSVGVLAEDGSFQVNLFGPPSTPVSVESILTGQIFATAVTDQNGDAQTLLTAPLQLGDVVGARTIGWPDLNAPFFAPYKNWGAVDTLLLGQMKTLGPYDGAPSYIGNASYLVGLDVDIPNPAQSAGSHNAWLAVGTENDVVPLGGGRFLLNAPVVYGLSMIVDDEITRAATHKDLPIPNSQALVGSTVCYQWWIQDTDGIVKNGNIAQVMIRDTPITFPATQSANSSSTKTSRSKALGSKANARVVMEWLKNTKGRIANRDRVTLLRKLLSRGK